MRFCSCPALGGGAGQKNLEVHMRGRIGTACEVHYVQPKVSRRHYKLGWVARLSKAGQRRYKAITFYASGRYTLDQIYEFFEIDRSTFYRWRQRYKNGIVQTLEDRSRRPKNLRQKNVRTYPVEHAVCELRRRFPYFGKEKIKHILERDENIHVSVSTVGRILTQYKAILPSQTTAKKRAKARREKKVRIAQVALVGCVSERIQGDTIELNLRWIKMFIFSAVDPLSKLLYMRAYAKKNSKNGEDFLRRLHAIHNNAIRYFQIDNGSEFEGDVPKEAEKLGILLVHNYPKSPKMNAFVEKVNETIQTEYLDRFYEETSIPKINQILLSCLLEYNFYRPHRSLDLLTPVEFCAKKAYPKNPSMMHMYRTQATGCFMPVKNAIL